MSRAAGLLLAGAVLLALQACSLRQYAVQGLGEAIAGADALFAADDDPQLVREAAPFSLKLVEALLAERPRDPALLGAAARGFTQYAYAFVQQDAEEIEERDVAEARRLEERARRLYRRARDYGVRGLAQAPDDVALLYWTGASWAALIALSKDDPEALAQLPEVSALLARALALDESFGQGALHVLMIGFQPARAREHFERAMALSRGTQAAPLVALAEALCVPEQRRAEFEALLHRALAVDTAEAGASRLANLVAQRRARWLLSRTERLFTP